MHLISLALCQLPEPHLIVVYPKALSARSRVEERLLAGMKVKGNSSKKLVKITENAREHT